MTDGTRGNRRHDIDWLRVGATYLLFFFHVGKVFDVPPFYHIKNAELSPGMGLFTGFIHQWHMPLFFLLAGWSAFASLAQRGTRAFLRERVLRIFLPFVAGCVLLCPLLKYVELLQGTRMMPGGKVGVSAGFNEGFFEFLPSFFTSLDRFSWAHMWFLIYLFTFTLLYLPLFTRLIARRDSGAGDGSGYAGWVYVPVVPLALIQMILRGRWPGFQNLYDDWANFSYYSLYFILGFLLALKPGFERAVQREWKRAGVIGLVTLAVMIPPHAPLLARALSAVAGWCCVMALLGLGARFLRVSNAALRYLSESAFPVYILHQSGIVLLAYFVIQLSAGIATKYVMLLVGSVVVTMAAYHGLVRRFALTRFLFGMKVRAATSAVESIPRRGKGRAGSMTAAGGGVALALLGTVVLGMSNRSAAAPLGGSINEWPAYGRDPGGSRYAPLAQITRQNVHDLQIAWTYRTGDVPTKKQGAAFEATPILVDGTLYLSTPFNRVIALDAETGAERWTFDPKIDLNVRYSDFTSRGVSTWLDPTRNAGEPCRRRIYHPTNDSRLFALDAATGKLCADFGDGGYVDLSRGVGKVLAWEYGVTSPPAIICDLVVVGSKVADNQRLEAPSGVVRAFDARSGQLRWSWDTVPPGFEGKRAAGAGGHSGFFFGTANAWAPLSADPERDLVFVPTGNTSPDYFGGLRHGSDYFSSSVVALQATTGQVVWRFQTVHHDLWDYDVPAQPSLITVRREGKEIAAVVQATKMGHVFLLDRVSGTPLWPVEERAVPQTTVPGEVTAPTQPFPVVPPGLVPQRLRPEDAWGLTPWDRRWCRKRIEALRSDGIFTPPSLEGSLMIPGNGGGTNWGGVAFDPERGVVLVNASNFPFVVRLIPRERYDAEKAANPGIEISPQTGTPYGMAREVLLSPLGIPCNPPPWGTLAAIDVASGAIRWQVTLGTTRDIFPVPIGIEWGTPNLGGPVATASGVVFIGAAMDNYLRAYDVDTGTELWKGRLPAGGQATPMTYQLRDGGKQFVVIAAGGHARAGTTLGDYVVAFALP